jgi:hypothetical protein
MLLPLLVVIIDAADLPQATLWDLREVQLQAPESAIINQIPATKAATTPVVMDEVEVVVGSHPVAEEGDLMDVVAMEEAHLQDQVVAVEEDDSMTAISIISHRMTMTIAVVVPNEAGMITHIPVVVEAEEAGMNHVSTKEEADVSAMMVPAVVVLDVEAEEASVVVEEEVVDGVDPEEEVGFAEEAAGATKISTS